MNSSNYDFDVIIIGGGPAGYAAAVRALDFGKRVLIVEKNRLGGAGIFDGALTSKTMWELSKDISRIKLQNRGYIVGEYKLSYPAIMEAVNQAAEEKSGHMIKQFQKFETDLYPGRFKLLYGFARLLSNHEVEIDIPEGVLRFSTENIVLAMGTHPRTGGYPVDEKLIVTSDGVGNFQDFPESMVVIGAGIIGCEFATIFSNLGLTKVNIVDRADRILPFEDEDVTNVVAHNFIQHGVTIHRKSKLQTLEIENNRVKYVLTNAEGEVEVHYVEKALISIGRDPNVNGMGLREVGIQFDERGGLLVNDTQTNIPNIYVVGDLSAEICLVNVGEQEARHAVEKMFSGQNQQEWKKLSYSNVSTIMFLEPEVAGIGLNEMQAQKMGLSYRIASYPYEYVSRAIAMRNTDGFFKILVTDDDEMRILGMRAVGAHASSSIQAAALLISMGKGIEELAELIHPHPSIVEGVQECVRLLLGKSIVKPSVFNSLLRVNRVVDGKCVDYIHSTHTSEVCD